MIGNNEGKYCTQARTVYHQNDNIWQQKRYAHKTKPNGFDKKCDQRFDELDNSMYKKKKTKFELNRQ